MRLLIISNYGSRRVHQPYLTNTNNLDKPALHSTPQPIAYINLKFVSHRNLYIVIFSWVGAGFRDSGLLAIIVGEPAPTKIGLIIGGRSPFCASIIIVARFFLPTFFNLLTHLHKHIFTQIRIVTHPYFAAGNVNI